MMSLIFVSSAFSSHRIEVVGGSAVVSTAARIFLRLLIAELYALLLFWHCFVTSCFVVCYFVSTETGKFDGKEGGLGQPILWYCLVFRWLICRSFYHY